MPLRRTTSVAVRLLPGRSHEITVPAPAVLPWRPADGASRGGKVRISGNALFRATHEYYHRSMKRVILFCLAAAVFALPAAAADISGTWTVTGEVVGHDLEMKCTFTQAGDRVTGTCSGPQVGSASVAGNVAPGKVSFTHTVQRDQVYELTYSGTLDAAGSSMHGDIAVAGVSGTFSATKEVAPAVAPASSREFAGNWTIEGDVVGNAIHMKCAFTREDDKITGNCNYQGLADSATTGTVRGDRVTFENQVRREELYDLTYSGKLDASGSAIEGEISVAGVTGTFSGTRDR